MRVPVAIRVIIVLITFFSLFWLPWPVTLLGMFLSGLIFPPLALLFGILADLLYYPGHGFLWASFEGLILMLLSAAVRHFVKTRIM